MRIMTLKKAWIEFRISTPLGLRDVSITSYESAPAQNETKALSDDWRVYLGWAIRATHQIYYITPANIRGACFRRRHSARGNNYIRSRATGFDYCFVNRPVEKTFAHTHQRQNETPAEEINK
jgi:hypothetical protein